MDANEQRARELRDQYCPAGNYEYSDVLDAIMAALDMKPALSKPKVQTEHLWCTNCEGVHPESCFNATPSAQQVPADGEAVAWQHRIIINSYGSWSGWGQSSSAEEAAETVRRYEANGIKAEWRSLYAATPQAPQPVVDGMKMIESAWLDRLTRFIGPGAMAYLSRLHSDAAALAAHGKPND